MFNKRIPWCMRSTRNLLLLSSCMVLLAGGLAAACGDDDADIRPRPDSGPDTSLVDTGGGGGGDGGGDAVAACMLTLPNDYVSPAYATNAALELGFRTAFGSFLRPMINAENAQADGGAHTALSKNDLVNGWQSGNPSVKSITTPYYQARIDAWLGDYETASNAGSMNTQMAVVVTPPQTPPSTGGYYGKYVYNGALVDLRQAIEKGSYTAAFYNHAVGIVAGGNLTDASIDRLLAAWGAHPTFQNNHLSTAGADDATRDVNSAGYAARRTPKDGKPGPYTRAKVALIKAKAAIGAKCDAERDAALKEFFLEWEKATYATVVFYFNDIIAKLSPSPPAHTDASAWTNIFHAHGECLGFIAGFKTTPAVHRKITDAQIDSLLAKALAPEGGASKIVELKTAPTTSVISLNGALAEIKTIYGFSDEEMTSFKQVFTKP